MVLVEGDPGDPVIEALVAMGVRRQNVSPPSLDPTARHHDRGRRTRILPRCGMVRRASLVEA